MSQNPSYKELEKRVIELEQIEEELRKSEEKYRQLVEASDAVIFIVNYEGNYLFMNEVAAEQLGGKPNDFIGQTVFDIFPQEMAEYFLSGIRNIISSGKGNVDVSETLLQGKIHWYKTIGQPLTDRTGKPYAAMFIGIDETKLKQAEDKINEYTNNLEKMVKDRTEELELQAMKVEQTNIALRVLMKKQEKDKNDLQEQIVSNIKKLIIPHFDILKGLLSKDNQYILDLLISNLYDITSSFSYDLSSEKYGLTSSELLIAGLIMRGKKTKEIAALNSISHKTVEVHRNNIRKKIGIAGKKINLQTYLRSITN